MARNRLSLGVLAAVLLLAAVCAIILLALPGNHPTSPQTAYATPPLAKMPAAASAPGAAGEWHIPAGDYASTRYSNLAQITTQNVGHLKPAFTFDTGFLKGHEAAPLIVGSTMYLVTPFPNVVYALDLTKPTTTVK